MLTQYKLSKLGIIISIFTPFHFILNNLQFPNLEYLDSRKKVNFYIIGEYNKFIKYKIYHKNKNKK